MSQIIQIADRLGKSPDMVRKMIRGDRAANPEEKAILTDVLGPDAGAAYDIEAVNERRGIEIQRLTDELIEERALNRNPMRKWGWLSYVALIVMCLMIAVIANGQKIIDALVERQHGVEILQARLEASERKIETLEKCLAGVLSWNDLLTLYGKETEEQIRKAVGE